ncbi:hypothetical protein IMSAG025_00307 [Muribaculaceae bacterium]|nr:hypothetical protein IMSAG025_00307 [Muribaculaceae bacterium]
MLFVVSLHCSFKRLQSSVNLFIYRNIHLSRCSPKHNHALYAGLFLEIADILADLLGHIPAIFAILHIVSVKTLRIIMVECGFQWLDCLKLVFYRIDILLFQHLCVDSRLVCVGRIYIPCGKHYVIKRCKRNDILIMQIFLVFAFANANLIILSAGTDRFCQPLASHEYTGHECRCNGTETYHHYAKFTFGRFCFFCCHNQFMCVFLLVYVNFLTVALPATFGKPRKPFLDFRR